MFHSPRVPPVPAFGVGPPLGPAAFMSPGISPVHNLHPRMPINPMQRGITSPPESVSNIVVRYMLLCYICCEEWQVATTFMIPILRFSCKHGEVPWRRSYSVKMTLLCSALC